MGEIDILGLFSMDATLFGGIVATAVVGIFGIIVAIILYRLTASRKQLKEFEKKVEKQFGDLKVYLDGLPKAKPAVRNPFEAGRKAMAEYKWDDAIGHFNEAMKEAKGTELVALYNLIGICHYTPGRLNQALESFEESARLAKEFNDKEGEAIALGNIGNIYQTKGELDKALKYFEDGLKIDREMDRKKGIAAKLGNIGLIYQTKGELDKALKYSEDALKITKEMGNKEDEAKILGNIGVIYQTKGELDKALKYHEEALKLDREIGNKEGEAQDLGNIGNIYAQKGDFNKALDYLNQALVLFKQIGAQMEIEIVEGNIKRLTEGAK